MIERERECLGREAPKDKNSKVAYEDDAGSRETCTKCISISILWLCGSHCNKFTTSPQRGITSIWGNTLQIRQYLGKKLFFFAEIVFFHVISCYNSCG